MLFLKVFLYQEKEEYYSLNKMEKEEKDAKGAVSDKVRGSGEKPKIKPHPKITPTQKSSEGGINEEMKSKHIIQDL